MPTSYSQTIESDEVLQEQQEQQQICVEGEVFNEQTQTCESTATASTTTDLGTETLELEAPAEELEAPVEEVPPEELVPVEEQQQALVEEEYQLPGVPEQIPGTGVTRNFESEKYICSPNSETLQVGSQGDKVKELETYLTDLGYGFLSIPLRDRYEFIDGPGLTGVDEKFDLGTKNSVMAYQYDNRLTVDGIVGPQTWFSLCKDIHDMVIKPL